MQFTHILRSKLLNTVTYKYWTDDWAWVSKIYILDWQFLADWIFLLVKIHYICKQMDIIYIFACLMQLDYVLTHTPEGIFKKKRKKWYTITFRDTHAPAPEYKIENV